jgi:Transposase domain (DUF772)
LAASPIIADVLELSLQKCVHGEFLTQGFSERGIAWRLADSLTLRQFLAIGLDEKTPDHVTISRTRRLIDAETHQRIFSWVLERLAQWGLIKGKTIGVDSTTLEANAAMKSIVRRDIQGAGELSITCIGQLAEDVLGTSPDSFCLILKVLLAEFRFVAVEIEVLNCADEVLKKVHSSP